jgi:hypothetical protein
MLRKFTSLFCVAALSVALVGCGGTEGMADKAKETVDTTADAAHDTVDEVVPEAAQETAADAVDSTAEAATGLIDNAAGTNTP